MERSSKSGKKILKIASPSLKIITSLTVLVSISFIIRINIDIDVAAVVASIIVPIGVILLIQNQLNNKKNTKTPKFGINYKNNIAKRRGTDSKSSSHKSKKKVISKAMDNEAMGESNLFTIIPVLILMEFQPPLLFTSIVLIAIPISYLLWKIKNSRRFFI